MKPARQPCEVIYPFFAMGSDCSIRLFADDEEHALSIALAAEAEVRRIEMRFSRYRPESELSRINQIAAVGGTARIDSETAALLAFAETCFRKSDGAFDITSGLLRQAWDFKTPKLPDPDLIESLLPRIGQALLTLRPDEVAFGRPGMEIDLGGVGKEYAADRAAEICLEQGIRHGFVDLSGDIRVIGPQPDGAPWRFGIRHPRDPSKLTAQVDIAGGALATSGDYERFIEVNGRRYCHILDPRTGWPGEGLSSVTVITDRCLVAGALATAAMVKGAAGRVWLESLDVGSTIVTADGEIGGSALRSSS